VTPDRIKAKGVHYTPPGLAGFLASVTVPFLNRSGRDIHVLDPACGEGALLQALADAVPSQFRKRLKLTGFETDAAAYQKARSLLAGTGAGGVTLENRDFLALEAVAPGRCPGQRSLFDTHEEAHENYDAVIANPPYVRTQVLGAERAQALARRFGLTGRVDLYQAFTKALANVLKPGGVLGLLTSNRFLTVKAGQTLRRLLRTEFTLRAVYDLGDTKLFTAAVLPVIVVANKRGDSAVESPCTFDRIYECRSSNSKAPEHLHVLEALEDRKTQGMVRTGTGHFRIERGFLPPAKKPDEVWTLSTPEYDDWLETVRSHQACTIQDVAAVRVGIKTTADRVFVRNDWASLPASQRPEPDLLFPLLTHHEAGRWLASAKPRRQVLYPHVMREGKRAPIDLNQYRRAAAYVKTHEERLRARKYVIDSGRKWYEIWVPHQPADWQKSKIVFPDISESPRFFLDDSGAIVQGDCYWITAHAGADPDWLFLILAVANSTFIAKFYDTAFHNQLYSGRRRFMTQYVKNFPLPPLRSQSTETIVRLTRQIVRRGVRTEGTERRLNSLVWQAFGLADVGWDQRSAGPP